MSYKKNNLALLEQLRPELLPLAKPGKNFKIVKSKDSKPVPQCLIHDRWASFHSLYAPEKEKLNCGFDFPVVLGMGGLFHVSEMICQNQSFILIEPDESFFSFMVVNVDLQNLLTNLNIHIFVGSQKETFLERMKNSYSPYLEGIPSLQIHQRSFQFFETSYNSWIPWIQHWQNNWITEISTQKKFGKNWYRNTILNIQKMKNMVNKKSNHKKYLILGAGPDIENHLKEIEAKKDLYTIISTDSILPYLNANDISPDYILTLDPQIISYLHYINGNRSDVILDISAHGFPLRQERNVYFCGNLNPLVQWLCPSLIQVNTALGNVSSGAVDLAIQLGAEEILIYGVNFSFPVGKTHSRGTYLVEYFQTKQSRLTPLENQMYSFSINQSVHQTENIRTTERLKKYKTSLENFLLEHPDVISFNHQDRCWKIKLKETKGQPLKNESTDNREIERYKIQLENLRTKDLPDLKNWDKGSKQALSTLFPLSASYLTLRNIGPEASLENARIWALDQLKHLI